ncbi:MAG: tetratricopeptide repeat protein [Acidobacteriota bacterium]|nr:tetratricopeptide repeat protein [Acidobacteriota bacterium]MDQ7088182.1 tetratricopeptide repeat protein [Acidobacteriota bacterium]
MKQTLRVLVVSLAVPAAAGTVQAFDPAQTLYRENRAGIAALEKDDPAAALEHFTEAQAHAPDDPRVLYNLGLALARAGKLEEADRAWKRAAQLARGELARDAWYNRGVAALADKNTAAAVDSFARALMIDPTDEEARRNLELALQAAQPQASQGGSQEQPRDQPQKQQGSQQGSSGGKDSKPSSEPRNRQDQGQRDGRQGDQEHDSRSGRQPEAPSPGDDRRQAPTPPQEDRPGPADGRSQAGDRPAEGAGADAERRDEDELAARLLKMLEQNEKSALRRALRRQRRGPHEKREKDW